MYAVVNQYECCECGYSAQNRKALATHVATVHTEKAFKCDLCDFITKYQANYYRHRRTLHGINSINLCEPCGTKFPTKDYLVEHTRQEHPELLDEVLEKVSKPSSSLIRTEGHQVELGERLSDEVDPEVDLDDLVVSIDECDDEDYDDEDDNEDDDCEDISEEHSIENLLQQELTEGTKEFGAEDANGLSCESDPNKRKKERVQRSHICKDCDFVTKESRDFLVHRKQVHGDRLTIYDCPWCSYASRQLQKLNRHASTVHNGEISPEEAKETIQRVVQEIHEAAQLEKESNIIAQLLDKGASNDEYHLPKAMVKTVRLPIAVSDAEISKPEERKTTNLNQWFTCSHCAFKARNRKIVEDHERTSHKSPLQFVCDICAYSCSNVQRFRAHVKFHAARKLKCDKCDFTTSYKWNLDRHMKYHTQPDGDMQCTKCDYRCNQLGSLKFHMNNHHLEGGLSGSVDDNMSAEDSLRSEGEMEGSSIGIDESSADLDDTEAVTCDLCGSCFLNQADLLDHNKKEHMNEIEAEQASMLRSNPRLAAAMDPSQETLARLQNRFGLSITPLAGAAAASQEALEPPPVVIELGNGNSLKRLIEGNSESKNGAPIRNAAVRSGTIFKCRYCPYSTKFKSEYHKHETIHKPHACSLCSFKTVWKNDLSKHIANVHGEESEPSNGVLPTPLGPPIPAEQLQVPSVAPATGGVLRNLLSTPELNQKESLLFKTLSGDQQEGGSNGKQTWSQDDIQNQALKLPPNAHYYCPYCNFITKTASRFHIHYMQHLNVRPFECSVCRIKSNWLWDINKHIRTRVTQGDASHKGAKCVCINEAGLRDYNKYRCFIKEGPNSGEAVESSDEQGEAGVVAAQSAAYPSETTVVVAGVASDDNSQNYMIQQLQKLQHKSNSTATAEKASTGSLKCGHCEYSCEHKDIMLGHLGAHAEVLPFICSKCGLSSKWHHTAWIHLQQFHRDEQVTLKDINLQLNYTQEANVLSIDPTLIVNPILVAAPNAENVSVVRQLRCSRCPYHTVQKSNMARHREGHQRARPEEMTLKCHYCDFWQDTRRAIQRHMALHPEHIKRGQERPAENVLVPVRSVLTSNGTVGQESTPGGPVSGLEDIPKYKCDSCPYMSTNNSQFIYHKQFHRYNPKAKYKCDKCSYWATHAHLISQHSRVHLEGTDPAQKYPEGSWLPPAEIAVSTEAPAPHVDSNKIRSFRVMKNGVVIKMHKCRYCPLMNRRKANVRYHELLHSESASGKFTCHLCSYRTHSQGVLGNHMKIHVAERKSRAVDNVELLEECMEEDSSDDEQVVLGLANDMPQPAYPAKAIKYNCSAVESELFNLLQNRQNGSKEDVVINRVQSSHVPSQTPGLARVKKTAPKDPYVRRSDGLVTFQSKVNLRKWIACPQCPALFMNPTEFSRHLDHHRYTDKFKCSKCNYSQNKFVFVSQHEQVHTEEYMVRKLGYCHRPIEGKGSAPSHSPAHSSSSRDFTPVKVMKPPTPKKPVPTPISVPVSEEASQNFDSDEYSVSYLMAEHLESKAVIDGVSSGIHKCSQCPAAFANSAVLRFHGTLHKKPERRLKCHVCTYSVTEVSNMMAHAQLHYSRPGDKKPATKQCPKCPATFTKQNFFESHLLRHGSNDRYQCEYCDFATNKSDIISRHRTLHRQAEESDQINCEENLDANSQISVGTLFRNASVPQVLAEDTPVLPLESVTLTPPPEQVEEEKKLYACTSCPYTYARKDGMGHHMRRHFVIQQFDCPHCTFTVNTATTLRDHIKSHFVTQRMCKPQAFLHYDDIKIMCAGETIFEDRGGLDNVRFYPDQVPEFEEEKPDLLVEFIDSDVFSVVNSLLDNVCADRRKLEREISISSIYGNVVRRTSSQRNSQDEPPSKRSKTRSTGSGGELSDPPSGNSTPRKMSVEENAVVLNGCHLAETNVKSEGNEGFEEDSNGLTGVQEEVSQDTLELEQDLTDNAQEVDELKQDSHSNGDCVEPLLTEGQEEEMIEAEDKTEDIQHSNPVKDNQAEYRCDMNRALEEAEIVLNKLVSHVALAMVDV